MRLHLTRGSSAKISMIPRLKMLMMPRSSTGQTSTKPYEQPSKDSPTQPKPRPNFPQDAHSRSLSNCETKLKLPSVILNHGSLLKGLCSHLPRRNRIKVNH